MSLRDLPTSLLESLVAGLELGGQAWTAVPDRDGDGPRVPLELEHVRGELARRAEMRDSVGYFRSDFSLA